MVRWYIDYALPPLDEPVLARHAAVFAGFAQCSPKTYDRRPSLRFLFSTVQADLDSRLTRISRKRCARSQPFTWPRRTSGAARHAARALELYEEALEIYEAPGTAAVLR